MRTVEKTIDGRDAEGKPASVLYRCCTHGARKGLDIILRLSKLLGPGIGALGDAMGVKGLKDGLASDHEQIHDGAHVPPAGNVLERAAKALLAGADSQDTTRLILDILERTQRVSPERKIQEVGRSDVFDEVYCENYGELASAVAFALEVNYGSFFGAGGLIGRLMERVQTPPMTTSPSSRGSAQP